MVQWILMLCLQRPPDRGPEYATSFSAKGWLNEHALGVCLSPLVDKIFCREKEGMLFGSQGVVIRDRHVLVCIADRYLLVVDRALSSRTDISP